MSASDVQEALLDLEVAALGGPTWEGHLASDGQILHWAKLVRAELERLQAENKEMRLDALSADGEFIEMSGRLNDEVEAVTAGLQAKINTLQREALTNRERIAALEAITDPCEECHRWTDAIEMASCGCGGLGRVPRAPQDRVISAGAPIAALRSLKLLGAETDRMVRERIISERSGLADIWLDGKRSLAEFEESVFPIRLGGSWETQEGNDNE